MAIKTYKDTTASASVVNDSDVLVIQQGENNTLTEMKQTTVEALKEDLVRKEVGKVYRQMIIQTQKNLK